MQGTILYTKSYSNLGLISFATVIIWVIYNSYNTYLLYAHPILPIYKFSRTFPGLQSFLVSFIAVIDFIISKSFTVFISNFFTSSILY